MNETKWTPGPWRIVQRNEQEAFNGRRLTLEGKSGMVADFDWNSPKQNLANAMLCAKAPEMAEALSECDNLLTHDGPCQCCPGSNEHGHDERCLVLTIRSLLNAINDGGSAL